MEEVIKMLPRYRVPVVKKDGRRKKTHEEYVTELAVKNPNIEVLENYQGANTKILHKCLKENCRYQWYVSPHSILNGTGCPQCAGKVTRTHDEYVCDVKKVNNNIEVIETFKNTHTAILHKCLICEYQWKCKPTNILLGTGCPKCANNIKKTHEKYVKEVFLLNPNIEVIGKYINCKTPIIHKCIIHNTEWSAQPNNILQGKGCPDCAKENRIKNNSMSHDEYVKQIKEKNSTIEVIGEYVNAKTKILHHCTIHDVYWDVAPNSVIYKMSGCPECKKDKFHIATTKTRDEYVNELAIKNPIIELVGDYLGHKNKTQHYCKIHNCLFDSTPENMLNGCGCKQCCVEKMANKKRKTHEQYVIELKNVNPDIIVLDTYIEALTPILHKCLIDGYEWNVRPSNILRGDGCPRCNESSGERQVRQWLEKNNISYIFQHTYKDCRDINLLPFDFYLPDFNTIVEYDHKQHFEPVEHFGGQESFEKTVKHDKMKNEYCKNNGISLLRIPYFKNVEEELNNFLLY